MTTTAEDPRGTLLRRIARTPLRDVMRGRLTSRLDVDAHLAGLPAPIAAHVRAIIRATRLWRLEKGEVAAELAAHFADGLAEGAAPETLVCASGDPATVARLLRRARRRQRPWPWHALRWTALAVLGLVVVAIVYSVIALTAQPSPTTDYLALLNADAVAVAPDDRAWPLYREALIALEAQPALEHLSRMPRPGETGWEEIEAWLARQQDALALARDGATRAGLGYVPGAPPEAADRTLWPHMEDWRKPESMFEVLLPHLGELRPLAEALALDARRAAAAGDGARSVANLAAIVQIARHARETPIIISDLVAAAISVRASDTAGDILATAPQALTTEQLVELAHVMQGADDVFEMRLHGERLSFADLLQRMYTDDGDGNGSLTREGVRFLRSMGPITGGPEPTGNLPEAVATPGMRLLMASRRDMLAKYNEIMDAYEIDAERPIWDKTPSTADGELARLMGHPRLRLRYMPVALLTPALGRVGTQGRLARARRDAVLVAIALEVFQRETGAYPQDLTELVPRWLPEIPVDCFDGQPLRYALRAGGPVIYSVGADTDDDGAAPYAQTQAGARSWPLMAYGGNAPDGDWIIWPPTYDDLIVSPPAD
jgi:hypothetical protein